jgi:uncharacterized protein YycO
MTAENPSLRQREGTTMNESLRTIREIMNDIRHKEEGMVKVEVRGYTGQGAGSKWIQRWTRSNTSHVSLVFHMGGSVQEVEAIQFKGVVVHEPHSARDKTFVEYDVPLSYEQVMEARELALSLVGAKYDWKAIWGFARHRKTHSLNKWFCSELVAYCLLKATYPLSRREPFLESPATVCESLRLLRS